ncbi:metallophosphoesterase family protein [Murimonas intestini]|uniref:Phosphoesterase n=1 Tax=Murimonas intestini TaxID=1337051 RepID=A0AB73T7N2_9FIRM|nr:metallophosphoesterase [Murimonas intestini]MCR1839639.1 metallophosphoesterase [Murimonas intestini]MCR1866482.1 metallophosphoesterase [Murimonas intestini]MCR1884894.1 metallophosphoesterase [Murimonas intestini]
MKILIVSDTHRHDANLVTVINKVSPIDRLIHLGDAEGSEDYIRQIAECPVNIVSGNNDFFCDLPREEEFMIGKYRVMITHGHYYYVSLDMQEIKRQAVTRGIDIVMFGHTHKPYLEKDGGITILNPGSLSYPRQEGHKPSYIIMDVDRDGEAHFTVNYLG